MSHTASLYRLQQTDSQIDRSQVRMKEINEILGNVEELQSALALAESARQNHLKSEHAVRQAEAKVQDQRTKIEQTEASLYSGNVKNPKELQDLQNDLVSLKKHISTLEDQLLESMMTLEEVESASRSAQENLENLRESESHIHSDLLLEQGLLQKEIIKLNAERQAIISAIPAESLHMYEELRKDRRGVAVSGVSENACEICGAILTPAQAQEARSLQKTIRCSNCGRILYVTETK